MARKLTSLLLLIIVMIIAVPVYADTASEKFTAAENTFKFQDYENAAVQLEELLYPKMRLKTPSKQIKAREYLAACYFWLGRRSRMKEEFTALLTRAPLHELDPFFYPGKLIQQFQDLKQRLIELHILDPEKARLEKKTECTITVEEITRRSKLPMLIPFGVGQFVNDKTTKGALFLTGELVFLGMNIGAWAGAESLRGSDGMYSRANAGVARQLRIVQYVGLGAFAAVAIWGIVDAFMDFKPVTKKLKVLPCPTGTASNGGPDGIGICFSWKQ